jgi:hypothetical protein
MNLSQNLSPEALAGESVAWSYGGGTQSAAIAVLVLQGKLPRPDIIVMADTAREATETWEYLHNVVNPALKEIGLEVEIASHDLAKKDLWGGKEGDTLLMPVYTEGGEGRLPSYCSAEWKREPVNRYLRSMGYGPKKPIVQWFGMSVDELQRLNGSTKNWVRNAWPLCFPHRLRRIDCVRLVEDYGWPTPPKSSCWMCPHRGNSQWRHLRDNYPQDWESACNLDDEIRRIDPNTFVHRSGVPLREANINDDSQQLDLLGCSSGFCFV